MIRMRGRLDARQVTAALAATRRRGPKITAQEINTQRRQSRTRIARRVARTLGITPLKRVRDRVRLPLNGAARPGRLSGVGLALVHVLPARWFLRGRGRRARLDLPGGVRLIEGAPATGEPFVADAQYGAEVFRRGAEPRTRETLEGEPTWLPVKAQNVDTSQVGDRAITVTLAELANEWPERWARRMQREIRRIWGT